MGIQVKPILQHWNYFLALDNDVAHLARYVEPVAENFSTYSLELARILFAAASEVDVLAKLLCKKIDENSKAKSIDKYREEIFAAFPKISGAVVTVPRFGLTLSPWDPWVEGKTPLWWNAYNNVKHQRHTHFLEANLKHALNSVAALFILLLYYYREEGETGLLNPLPGFFQAGYPFASGQNVFGLGEIIYTYIGD